MNLKPFSLLSEDPPSGHPPPPKLAAPTTESLQKVKSLYPSIKPPDPVGDMMPPNPWGESGGFSKYLKENKGLLPKLEKAVKDINNPDYELTGAELDRLCRELENCGLDGLTVEVFAGQLRLTEAEFTKLLRHYPALYKSAVLLGVNRKKGLMESLFRLGHKNATAVRELLDNPEFASDNIKELMAAEESANVRATAERYLLDKEVKPCEYLQVLVVTGDKKNSVDQFIKDVGLYTPKEIVEGEANEVLKTS